MRPAILAGVVLVGLPVTGPAQVGPYLATVADPEVKLRAGPSDKFPETTTLLKGMPLYVMGEDDNGWLKVCDAPGKLYSFSWVPMQFIDFNPSKPLPQPVMVEAETTLAAGQVGLAQPLETRRTTVPAGTGLTVIGKGVQFERKTWYPVVCPANDFRYVPKQALKIERPATTSFTVRDALPPGLDSGSRPASGTGGPTASLPGGGGLPTEPAGGAGKPIVQHPLWAQAEAAEREGRLEDADKLYFQLARVMNEPGGDHDIANLCYSRIHAIREKKRTGSTGASTATPPRPPVGEPTRPVRTAPTPPKPAASEAGSGSLPPVTDPQDDRAKWTAPGRLTRSALALDRRRTYALEITPGTTALYVVPGQGVDLERFVGKKVVVYGVSASRSDLSKPFVVATGVESR